MKHYLSHGGGVNSTALMLILEREGIEFESVFVDHGGDYPETYNYIKYLQEFGHPITVIKPSVSGCSTIEEYALKYHIIPARWERWCTTKFKLQPIRKYFENPCVNYIGYSYEERRRRKAINVKGVENKFPLIDRRITRRECIEIIKRASLRVPGRSGCWLCPFMSRKAVVKLYIEYPDLYRRRKHMEENTGRGFYFDQAEHYGGSPIPMSTIVGENCHKLEEYL